MIETYTAKSFIGRCPLLTLDKIDYFLSPFTIDKLKELYRNPLLREAIFVSSPSLYNRLLKGESDTLIWEDKKFQESLVKYALRAITRCTPYGLFAGVFSGEISHSPTEIILSNLTKRIRLDMGYLANLHNDLLDNPDFALKLNYSPNNSLYLVANKWRYIESSYTNKRVAHNLVHVDNNPVLERIITSIRRGICFDKYVELVESYGYSKDDAQEYIQALIKAQVLISDVHPSVSGDLYQTSLLKKVELIFKHDGLSDEVVNLLDKPSSVMEVANDLDQLLSNKFSNTSIEEGKFIQVDSLYNTIAANINVQVVEKIKDAAKILNHLVRENNTNSTLEVFKDAIRERYEEQEVSLPLLLDTDIGINYTQAYKEMQVNQKDPNNVIWDRISKYKFELYSSAIKENKHEVLISKQEVDNFPVNDQLLPKTMLFMGELFYKNNNHYILWNYMGHNPTSLLGRFGYLSGEIKQICNDLIENEEAHYEDVVFAEIVHVSEGRLGNVVTRPKFRNYEIPFLANSNLPVEQQIPVSDLMVSVKGGVLYIRSKRLNKLVEPRMSNAHNYSASSLPIYNFLCDVQKQNIKPYINWSWEFLEEANFLPRVRYENVILRPAIWNIQAKNLQRLLTDKSMDRLLKFRELEEFKVLPKRVMLVTGENNLLLDLNEIVCIDLLVQASKHTHTLRFTEFIQNEFESKFIDELNRGFANEIIIPFVNNTQVEVKKPAFNLNKEKAPPPLRKAYPVDNWIYYKIYTGQKMADVLITAPILKLVRLLRKRNLIRKWFFVRYADPKHHIRLRFLINDDQSSDRSIILSEVTRTIKKFYRDNIIWRVQIDTYVREIERYGADYMDISESVFHINSECVQSILLLFKEDFSDDRRFLAGILGIDRFIDAFRCSEKEKLDLIEKLSVDFFNEFNGSSISSVRDLIKDKFRSIRPIIDSYYLHNKEKSELDHFLYSVDKVLMLQTKRIKEIPKDNFMNKEILFNLLSSYCHMFMNRLFNNNQRFQEMLVYNLLAKYYRASIAKRQHSGNQN